MIVAAQLLGTLARAMPALVLAAGTGTQTLTSPAMPNYSTYVLMAQTVPGTWWTITEEVPVRTSSR